MRKTSALIACVGLISSVHSVSAASMGKSDLPKVYLTQIAKPDRNGMYTIAPRQIRGKHLVITNPDGSPAEWAICIGRHTTDGGCNGIYISNK